MHALLQSVPPTPCLYRRLLDTQRQVSCGVTVPFSWVLVHWVLVHKFLLCPPVVYFPVLCKFWQLHGGGGGHWRPPPIRLMPYPHSEPLSLQQTNAALYPTGDAQTQFCLSLCGVPGSWCAQICLSPLSISGENEV